MTERERMTAYIGRTKMKNTDYYCLALSEILTMYEIAESGDLYCAFKLAFEYGRAKGYRMARKEKQHG